MSKLYDAAHKATKKLARSLKIGDVIECYYTDDEKSTLEMVVQATESSKKGDCWDIRTIDLQCLGGRSYGRSLNTDKFSLYGVVKASRVVKS